jgi:hypothetical protein
MRLLLEAKVNTDGGEITLLEGIIGETTEDR